MKKPQTNAAMKNSGAWRDSGQRRPNLASRWLVNNFCFDELVIFLLAQPEQVAVEVFVVFRQ